LSEKRTGADAIVEALVEEGVDTIFGLTGSHVLGIYDVLADTSIRHVSCKHEQNGAFMADAYGRLTGRPGILIVTAGPGATNSMTGIAQAFGAASPVIHIAGTVDPDSPKEAFHGVDNPRFMWKMFRDITKWTAQIESVEEIPEMMAKAFQIATEGRPGPVHLDIPEILVNTEADIPPYQRSPSPKGEISEKDVETVAKLLLAAKRPVIVSGRGVIRTFATEKLAKLAELLNAIVTVSSDAIAAFPNESPHYAGLVRQWIGDPLAESCMEAADVILALGLRVGTETVMQLEELANSKNFMFVGYGEPEDQLQNCKMALFEDVDLFLSKLLALLETKEPRAAVDQEFLRYIANTNQLLQEGLIKALEPYQNNKPLHFGLVVQALADRLEEDAIVLIDNGSHNVFSRLYLKVRSPTGFFSHSPWGTMGSAVPSAIAAKIVHPERQVIVVTSDGSFLMGCNDFGTAVENEAHIKIFMANNHHYDMIRYLHTMRYGRSVGADILPIDFVKFAESFGATGLRVDNPAVLEATLDRALALDAVVLLDVQTEIGSEYPRRATILEKNDWKPYKI
jgi:acetolactate synthase-1/2/3 large subunit